MGNSCLGKSVPDVVELNGVRRIATPFRGGCLKDTNLKCKLRWLGALARFSTPNVETFNLLTSNGPTTTPQSRNLSNEMGVSDLHGFLHPLG
jgi:hypothetical protein